ncbi:hypothetical protein I79_001605 [Cricetulus griseus]|uniref:Uncharacterized protein n=1 Tax=Cricetulus griseus TaxID=10029 RepID=G3GV74_CRIGR|nr:hypothetical protein I79_001605 [Cricetulus griseus]
MPDRGSLASSPPQDTEGLLEKGEGEAAILLLGAAGSSGRLFATWFITDQVLGD